MPFNKSCVRCSTVTITVRWKDRDCLFICNNCVLELTELELANQERMLNDSVLPSEALQE